MSNDLWFRATRFRTAVATMSGLAGVGSFSVAHTQPAELAAQEVTVHADIAYVDEFLLDIYVPPGPGPFPTAVTLHGAARGKVAMEPIAQPLAQQGWIVFNPNWLSRARPFDGDELERSVEAAACALRFAAAVGPDYGGSGEPLTVIGLSAGGLAGSLVSLSPSEFGGACETAAEAPHVELFLGLEGAYVNAAEGSGGLAAPIADRPDLATRLDPRSYLGEATSLRVVLFLGDQDPRPIRGTEMFLDALRDAGIHVELRRTTGPHLAATFTKEVIDLLRVWRPR